MAIMMPTDALSRENHWVRLTTKVHFQPNFEIVLENWVIEPPYSLFDATTLVPGSIKGKRVRSCAACPDEVHVAPRPPSSDANRSSRTDVVGFDSRP